MVVLERISNLVCCVDPGTGQRESFDIEHFHKVEGAGGMASGFGALMQAQRLVSYMVIGAEPVLGNAAAGSHGQSAAMVDEKTARRQSRLVELELARVCDLGSNDTRYMTISHLGHLIRVGDTVLGYDLANCSSTFDEHDLGESGRVGESGCQGIRIMIRAGWRVGFPLPITPSPDHPITPQPLNPSPPRPLAPSPLACPRAH